MNILVLAHFQNDSSPSCIFVHEQAIAYRQLGHTVTEISPIPRIPFLSVLRPQRKELYEQHRGVQEHDGVTIYYPRHFSVGNLLSQRVNGFLMYLSVKHLVKKIHRECKIDVIHAHMIDRDGYTASLLKKKFHIPVVITTHGSDCTCYFHEQHTAPYLIKTCNTADKVVAVSPKLQKILDAHLQPQKTTVIYNGVRQVPIVPAEKRPYSIVSVGALLAQKKFDVTIRAFAEIQKEFPRATLSIVGKGEEEDRLKALVNELGLQNSVEFLGYLPNPVLLQQLSSYQVFVLPSINEGFGIVYVEAMRSGCVPVGTKGEGIDGTIVDNQNGLLVSPNSVSAVVQAICKLFANPEQRDSMAACAEETVRSLTWENNAKQYIMLFQSIIYGGTHDRIN